MEGVLPVKSEIARIWQESMSRVKPLRYRAILLFDVVASFFGHPHLNRSWENPLWSIMAQVPCSIKKGATRLKTTPQGTENLISWSCFCQWWRRASMHWTDRKKCELQTGVPRPEVKGCISRYSSNLVYSSLHASGIRVEILEPPST